MYVAIDVGGTKTLVALLTPEGDIKQEAKFATPNDYQEFLKALKDSVSVFEVSEFTAGAAAIPGPLDRDNGLILSCAHLAWKNESAQHDLAQLFTCPFIIENDGKTGGLAEAILIKNEYKDVLYIAIGTGIGISHIVNGVNDQLVDDGGGHTWLVNFEETTQSWEDFAAGSAIVKQFGQKAAEITDPAIWQTIAEHLAIGLISLVKEYQPEVIVVGGGVGAHFEHFKEPLKAELAKHNINLPLLQAQHAEEAVIHGCYELIKQSPYGKAVS